MSAPRLRCPDCGEFTRLEMYTRCWRCHVSHKAWRSYADGLIHGVYPWSLRTVADLELILKNVRGCCDRFDDEFLIWIRDRLADEIETRRNAEPEPAEPAPVDLASVKPEGRA